MKRSVLHVSAGPLIPTLARLLAFTQLWANVLIPKIIIQYTFVSVDIAQRRCSESLDMAKPAGETAPQLFL